MIGIGRYTTSTTNMYNKARTQTQEVPRKETLENLRGNVRSTIPNAVPKSATNLASNARFAT
jgi:hypothetical protein